MQSDGLWETAKTKKVVGTNMMIPEGKTMKIKSKPEFKDCSR